MWILFRNQLSNEKIRQSAALPVLSTLGKFTAELLTKPAVVPAFIEFRLEFEEHNYLP